MNTRICGSGYRFVGRSVEADLFALMESWSRDPFQKSPRPSPELFSTPGLARRL